jgi:hypothetical protein
MIILFYHMQAEYFAKLKTFQMDLSFKRCAGSVKEFSIVQYSIDRSQCKISIQLKYL